MHKKSGFTLLEMLIVMVIMGVLFAMTLWFGSGRVKDLDRQSVSDQFVDGFSTLVGQSRTSSYLYGHKYTQLLVNFGSGNHGFTTSFSGNTSLFTWFDSSVFTINRIIANQNVLSKLTVELTPYAIACQLRSDTNILSGAILWATVVDQSYCYRLDPSLCTLKKTACK